MKTARGGPGRTVFDLFAPSGDYLGEVTLDFAIDEFALGRGEAAFVVKDEETGVQRVERWRVGG